MKRAGKVAGKVLWIAVMSQRGQSYLEIRCTQNAKVPASVQMRIKLKYYILVKFPQSAVRNKKVQTRGTHMHDCRGTSADGSKCHHAFLRSPHLERLGTSAVSALVPGLEVTVDAHAKTFTQIYMA